MSATRSSWRTNTSTLKSRGLAELDALVATLLAACSTLTMFRLDSFTIGAIIVIVIDLPVFGWILGGICMICRNFCH